MDLLVEWCLFLGGIFASDSFEYTCIVSYSCSLKNIDDEQHLVQTLFIFPTIAKTDEWLLYQYSTLQLIYSCD